MHLQRVGVLLIAISALFTSLVCTLIPVPPQMAPTIEPLQQTLNARLTEMAGPQPSATITFTPLPTLRISPTPSPLPPTITPIKAGGIAGSLGYPASVIPALRIVAFKVGEDFWKSVDTAQNARSFQINDLTPGKYLIVAYLLSPGKLDPNYSGGYSRAVLCGLTAKCTDHSLIPVEVKAGEITPNIIPADWYAPKGTFPRNPSNP